MSCFEDNELFFHLYAPFFLMRKSYYIKPDKYKFYNQAR